MSFSKIYFNREQLEDVTLGDIQKYFSIVRPENDTMEYKTYVNHKGDKQSDKENKIIETICGFLNSEGGILVWGAPKGTEQEDKSRKEKIFVGPLSPVDWVYEKDSLIGMITSKIIPNPRGIKVHRIDSDENGKYVYLIEVQKSEYSPHQTGDKYYMRIDGSTRPAPHHYVEALFRRVSFPNLLVFLKPKNFAKKIQDIGGNNEMFYLVFKIAVFNQTRLQNEYDISYRVHTKVGTFEGWGSVFSNQNGPIIKSNGREKSFPKWKSIIHNGEPLTEMFRIDISKSDLLKCNAIIHILIFIGGKYSPMKVSQYHLKINNPFETPEIEIIQKKRKCVWI